MFQISLPIEDLSRLKVSSFLSESGQSVLSLTFQSSSPSPSAVMASSGVYVSFEWSIGENGCWESVMNTNMQEKGDTRSCFSTMTSNTPGSGKVGLFKLIGTSLLISRCNRYDRE